MNKWSEENCNPIEDLIKAKELIKNADIKSPQRYITGIVNYDKVVNILKECECTYDDIEHNFGRLISNIKFNKKLCEYGYLSAILTLYGAILFLEKP